MTGVTIPKGGILLSLSTCDVIARGIAAELRGPAPNPFATMQTSANIIERALLPEDEAVLLTAEQVAGVVSVKPSTVYELSRRRIDPLPSVSIGRAKRFKRAEVDAWVDRQGSRRA